MKTLKNIAAETNRFTLEDVPNQWRHNEYCTHKLNREYEPIPDFLLNLEGYEVGHFFECKIQDEGTEKELYHIGDSTSILIKKKGSDIILRLSKSWSTKKYTFHLDYKILNKYQGINYDIKNRKLKELKEPNGIGVFTTKKVNDWFQYNTEYLNILETLLTEIEDGNAKIEREIADFCVNLKGAEVSKYQNITDVNSPLFRVRFTHYKDQKYLNTKIEFKGNLQDILDLQR